MCLLVGEAWNLKARLLELMNVIKELGEFHVIYELCPDEDRMARKENLALLYYELHLLWKSTTGNCQVFPSGIAQYRTKILWSVAVRAGIGRHRRRCGAPGGTRTPGLLVRSQSLYPAELRARSRPSYHGMSTLMIKRCEQMIRDQQRFCDGCGKPIPSSAKLASPREDRQTDLCLQCRIRSAQEQR